ncbi:MAG: cytochrome P450 [Myxococcota bacterium]|nr:cytochrome P450 [Myxococcota bacterium]
MNARIPPRIPGLPILGNVLEFRSDRAGLMLRAVQYGDAVSMRLGILDVLILNSPGLAHEVLVEKSDAFIKDVGLRLFGGEVLGRGLLTNEHESHRRQRHLMAPMFTARRVAELAPIFVACAERAQSGWVSNSVIDLASEMSRLALDVVGTTLFGSDVSAEAKEITAALRTAMDYVVRSVNSIVPLPPRWPTPSNLRNKLAVRRLDATVYRMIRARQRTGSKPTDFLSMLLAARDTGDGKGMSERQVRDEAMTIFLAGHETTANTLTWAWYLLLQNPSVYQRLQEELDTASASGLTVDLEQVPYVSQVLKETLRLYPPVYILGREAEREVRIGDYLVRKGTFVMINVLGIHRDRAYFDQPNEFRPERFTKELEAQLPRFAYQPFGSGPRVCIGASFASLEAQLALTTIARRVAFERTSGRGGEMDPLITLRMKGPLHVRVSRRREGSVVEAAAKKQRGPAVLGAPPDAANALCPRSAAGRQ